MRRNVMLVQAPPRAGFIIWTFVALYYVGIVLPLMFVYYSMKFMVIGLIWTATQIAVFLAQRKAAKPQAPAQPRGRHRGERRHPVERLILGRELSAELRERERVSA